MALRDAQFNPPSAPVVTPTGGIKFVQYGLGINGMVRQTRNGLRIDLPAADAAYVLLEDAYADDEKPLLADLRRFYDEVAAGKVSPDSFPDALLSKEIKQRRAAAQITPDRRPAFKPSVVVEDERKAKGK